MTQYLLDVIIWNASDRTVYVQRDHTATSVTIPADPSYTITIADTAFYGCPLLTSVYLSSSVTKIGKRAFVGSAITTL